MNRLPMLLAIVASLFAGLGFAAEQKAFENHMRAAGVPYRKSAAPLSFKLKN